MHKTFPISFSFFSPITKKTKRDGTKRLSFYCIGRLGYDE